MARNNVLVAFFSRTGNTRVIADFIHEKLGCDIFEIKPVDPYPKDYDATVDRARRELDSDFRPELVEDIDDSGSYDTVFVGYPCWWGTMPMAVFTFLEDHNLSGKKVVPFCTHEGSALGHSVVDIKKLCPESTILEGLAIKGSTVNAAQGEVHDWLSKVGIITS